MVIPARSELLVITAVQAQSVLKAKKDFLVTRDQRVNLVYLVH
jgi:hypothetical protein